MWIVEDTSKYGRAIKVTPKRDRVNRRLQPFFPLKSVLLSLCAAVVLSATDSAPSSPYDPDLKLGSTCRGAPSAERLKEALPSYIKELVVQWPRVGKRKSAKGCVTVARLTIFDHLGVPLTLSFELYREAQQVPTPDYVVVEDDEMPRAVYLLQPSSEHPTLLMTLAGPPAAARDSLERTLDFVDGALLAKQFATLK